MSDWTAIEVRLILERDGYMADMKIKDKGFKIEVFRRAPSGELGLPADLKADGLCRTNDLAKEAALMMAEALLKVVPMTRRAQVEEDGAG